MSQPLATHVASIAACLPEQFIAIGVLVEPAPDVRRPGRFVERVVRRRLERGLVEPGRRQDPAYAVDVEVLARVAGARPARAGRRRGRSPEPQHAERLDRLVARARVDRARHVADRPVDRAVGGQGDHRPAVVPLHEAGADDVDEDLGISHEGERTHPRSGARLGRRRSGTIARVSAPDRCPARAVSRSGRPTPRELDDLDLLVAGLLRARRSTASSRPTRARCRRSP